MLFWIVPDTLQIARLHHNLPQFDRISYSYPLDEAVLPTNLVRVLKYRPLARLFFKAVRNVLTRLVLNLKSKNTSGIHKLLDPNKLDKSDGTPLTRICLAFLRIGKHGKLSRHNEKFRYQCTALQ